MELQGASCVITGAGRGLGASLSRALAKRGARLLISDIDSPDLQTLAGEIGARAMHCNVTDQEQVVALGRAAMDSFGGIDVWINNAGVWMPYAPVENMDLNRARLLVDVNYFGTAYGMIEAVRHMRERGSGVILNTLSVRSLKGKALGAAYSASKFAAEGFTQAVRDEVRDSGIEVIGVYPYRIKTGLFSDNKHEDYEESMEPDDVANIIVENLVSSDTANHLEIWSVSDIRKKTV